jgi:hypothetical protein
VSLNYTVIYAALYERAASNLAGSAFRATLGGANAIFPIKDLAKWRDPQTPNRPSRVWAVWKPGEVVGRSEDIRQVGAAWWLYDDPVYGENRLNQALSELDTLYGSQNRFAFGDGHLHITFIGRYFEDDKLGLCGRECRLTFTRL